MHGKEFTIAFYCKTVQGVYSRWLVSHHTFNPTVQQISTSLRHFKIQHWTLLSLRPVDDAIINQSYSYTLMLSVYCSPVKLWYNWISSPWRVTVNQVLIESMISQVKEIYYTFLFCSFSVTKGANNSVAVEVTYLKHICKSHNFSTWWQSWAEDQSYSSQCLCTWKGSPSPEISSNLINSTLLAILSFRGQDKSI